ncbi:formate dehydrogenase accessory sulfurtransferase FdhD [Variovorax sp. HJSM1_2]|uniref:formate dehydrogenase accessory sulfurtransferase FdhD n=1 Tax=Variovorax sp. HJSM1_2 TaxID=3366263 RepID=UPI003BDCF9DE
MQQNASDPATTCDDTPLPPPLVAAPVEVFANGATGLTRDDSIAAEVPIALVFNGISHAVMMATPQDLSAFALGFALSEGLIDSMADCRGIDVFTAADAASCEVQLEISAACFARLKEKRRALAGRTGCGVCGIDSLQALDLLPERVARQPWLDQLDVASVLKAVNGMQPLQRLNAEAGSLHAAGWASPGGELLMLMEDVGRHNALDKLIGQLAEQKRLGEPGFVVMSSRASYELVRKCARMGIGALATVSAPTALAVQIAQQAQIRLWGLCRGTRAVRYTA